MDQERHPGKLWEHEKADKPDVEKQVAWGILLCICISIWVGLGYSFWLLFLR